MKDARENLRKHRGETQINYRYIREIRTLRRKFKVKFKYSHDMLKKFERNGKRNVIKFRR